MPLLGGFRPPLLVLLALLVVVAAHTALLVPASPEGPVTGAEREAQHGVAQDAAAATRATLDESVADLRRVAATLGEPPPTADALAALAPGHRGWLGLAHYASPDEASSGRPAVAHGEPLPAFEPPEGPAGGEIPPRLVRARNGEIRLLALAHVGTPERPGLLAALSPVAAPAVGPEADRRVQLVDQTGRVVAATGRDPGSAEAAELASAAVADGGAGGSLVGEPRDGLVTVAGYATLAGRAPDDRSGADAAGLGLTVVTDVQAPVPGPAAPGHRASAALLAGALLLIALPAGWLLRRSLTRPVAQLGVAATRLAGGDTREPVRVPRFGEPARIGRALESLRRQLAHAEPHAPPEPVRRRRPGLGVRTVVLLCLVPLVAWSAAALLVVHRADAAALPERLLVDQEQRGAFAAERVARGLREGHSDLRSVAARLEGLQPVGHDAVLADALEAHARYRALYLVDGSGAPLAGVGDAPSMPVEARALGGGPFGTAGIVALRTDQPLVAARVPAGGGELTLVGEFSHGHLDQVLARPGLGEVWLTDRSGTVMATGEDTPIPERLPEARLDDAVEAGITGQVSRAGEPAMITVTRLSPEGEAAALDGWHLVVRQSTSWLDLPANQVEHRTVFAGLLALTASVGCLGWLHIVVVRPLRALAARAEALADGDRTTPLYPVHHDEVGTVTRALERVRHQLPG
ncbi:HAMP domain-containing protein [Streptomyces triticirhizae]|uniref:histidine kinase n=2 Tax=Streptomyces triticirhizae TaxID=2483353 RepID=A0A3M2M675_9ACTN|nr:HAMP domain-containing protein [Streptomyces triticirhizae]